MPKQKAKSKSQAIREYLTENPGAAAKDVIAGLSGQGIKVNASLVYFTKGRMKGRKQRRTRVVRAARAVASARNGDPLTLIRDIKDLAVGAGDMES